MPQATSAPQLPPLQLFPVCVFLEQRRVQQSDIKLFSTSMCSFNTCAPRRADVRKRGRDVTPHSLLSHMALVFVLISQLGMCVT